MSRAAKVLVVRGHLATPWELRPWSHLDERFNVSFLQSASNRFETAAIGIKGLPARTLRDRLPAGVLFDHVVSLVGDRYLDADKQFAQADIVHAEELSFWFAAEAARRRHRGTFKLVQTVWETIPLMESYRTPPARRARRAVLERTDLFLPTTRRAKQALLLEGADPNRIRVCPPGIDVERFADASRGTEPPDVHVILSPGRLVWEKGHQDVIRAVAALHRGLVELPPGQAPPRLLIIGRGPEERRLRALARELGVSDLVELRPMVPYHEMPAVFARASCLVLASLPNADHSLYLGGVPRAFWEEQFGLVLIEAMAAGISIIASRSGAIPEVVGDSGELFSPGSWVEIAHLLAGGPLQRPPGARLAHSEDRVQQFSAEAMAGRLTEAYDFLLAD